MRGRPFLAALALAALVATVPATPSAAQDRVAFVNLELVLSLMPETRAASKEIETLEKKLTKDLETKQAYAQQKLGEAQEAAAGGAPEPELEGYRTELRKLEDEIRRQAADADRKLASRQSELLDPVLERLQGVIDAVAAEGGWTIVLNSVDRSGTSVILHAPEDRDLTRKVVDRLGIELPAKDPATPK